MTRSMPRRQVLLDASLYSTMPEAGASPLKGNTIEMPPQSGTRVGVPGTVAAIAGVGDITGTTMTMASTMPRMRA